MDGPLAIAHGMSVMQMNKESIVIRGARVHNLKDIDLEL